MIFKDSVYENNPHTEGDLKEITRLHYQQFLDKQQ
jgi:uridylate kinase